MQQTRAAVALTRLGYGARPGQLGQVARDPTGWVLGQVDAAAPVPAELAGTPTGAELVRAALERRRERDPAARKRLRQEARRVYRAEAGARTLAMVRSEAGFRERWVALWSNWFTVSVTRPQVVGLVGAFEREAIRPNVFGPLGDLLVAVCQHPAMLLYLDNAQSVGPDSVVGRRRGRGSNENLARELLELHTLGVDGGYTQVDVEALAEVLTGWSVGPEGFRYDARRHQPGRKTVLGRTYAAGRLGGEQALWDLSVHPSTAAHVARRVASHFVADDPPRALVRRLERAFVDSEGDLGVVARTLVEAPETWASGQRKVKDPQGYVLSMVRAFGESVPPDNLIRALDLLGQRPWSAPSPAGWDDGAEAWVGPDALLDRIDLAERGASMLGGGVERADVVAEDILGPLLSRRTLAAVRGASTTERGLALLLASPEFQRR